MLGYSYGLSILNTQANRKLILLIHLVEYQIFLIFKKIEQNPSIKYISQAGGKLNRFF